MKEIKKAACNCPLVKVFRKHTTTGACERQRACANGLNFLLPFTATILLYTIFLCVNKIFLNSLIICDLFSEIRVSLVKPLCLSIHYSILSRGKNTLGIANIKRVQ